MACMLLVSCRLLHPAALVLHLGPRRHGKSKGFLVSLSLYSRDSAIISGAGRVLHHYKTGARSKRLWAQHVLFPRGYDVQYWTTAVFDFS